MFIQTDSIGVTKKVPPSYFLNINALNGQGKSFQFKALEKEFPDDIVYLNVEGCKSADTTSKYHITASTPQILYDIIHTMSEGFGNNSSQSKGVKKLCRDMYYKHYINPILNKPEILQSFMRLSADIIKGGLKYNSFQEEVFDKSPQLKKVIQLICKINKEGDEEYTDKIGKLCMELIKYNIDLKTEEDIINFISRQEPEVLSSLAIHIYIGMLASKKIIFVDSLTLSAEFLVSISKISPELRQDKKVQINDKKQEDTRHVYLEAKTLFNQFLQILKGLNVLVVTTSGLSKKQGSDGVEPASYNCTGSLGNCINERVDGNILLERDGNGCSFSWEIGKMHDKNIVNYKLNTDNPAQITTQRTKIKGTNIMDVLNYIYPDGLSI